MATKLSLNHVGEQFQLLVQQVAVGLTLPTYLDPASNKLVAITPRHALIQIGAQPVRWRADGTDPNAAMGLVAAAGSTLSWLDPDIDYSALITRIEFIRDSTATGDSILEIAFFT